jgi:hypothetical protein
LDTLVIPEFMGIYAVGNTATPRFAQDGETVIENACMNDSFRPE